MKLWKRTRREIAKPTKSPSQILSVRVHAPDMELLKVIASSRGQTLSAYVREALTAQNPQLANFTIESVEVTGGITVEVPKREHLTFIWEIPNEGDR